MLHSETVQFCSIIDTAFTCNDGVKPVQTVLQSRALDFLLYLLLQLKEVRALEFFMWPKRVAIHRLYTVQAAASR